MLRRLGLFIALCAFVVTAPGEGASAEKAGGLLCADDIARHCKGLKPGGGRILGCLKEHGTELSADCRARIEEVQNVILQIEKSCAADIERNCSALEGGGGRIAACLRANESGLSEGCRETLRAARVLGPGEKARK